MLEQAGQSRPDKVEFLDAGVASYSPSIYYKKIKHLLDLGLKFDEVVLLSDSSDVEDEATFYFCIDDDPKYQEILHHAFRRATASPRSSGISSSTISWSPTASASLSNDGFCRSSATSGTRSRAITTGSAGPLQIPIPRNTGRSGSRAASHARSRTWDKLSDLLASRGIPLTIVVYPWAQQIAQGDRDSQQVQLWRNFCPTRCKAFIDLFPAFFAAADRDKDWYEHLYILGDDHFSAAGNRMLYGGTVSPQHDPEMCGDFPKGLFKSRTRCTSALDV